MKAKLRRMELGDLNQDERLALVALIEATGQADGRVSDDEESVVDEVVETLGPDAYQAAVEQADQLFQEDDDLKRFLQGIERTEAREIIYGTVLELAMADVASGHEPPLLSWLAKTWQLESRPEPPSD
ncbi:MAG TPA: TerB family tellurite resistance protein [Polyangia bacterium]|nr:TerB family tellurite resistance protein [Polyangia bacterium]